MEPGWIYVLVNSSMPDLVKVGRTTRTPAERVAELSRATGVATPFVIAFEQHVGDCEAAERAVHAALDRQGLRAARNREFFRGSAGDIIRVVISVTDGAAKAQPVPDLSAAGLMQQAERHLFGAEDTPQDVTEAVRCYKLAARHGSLAAFERLGAIYSLVYAAGKVSRRRVIAMLRQGVKLGNYYCHAELAALYAAECNLQAFEQAWEQFFRMRRAAPQAELEARPLSYPRALSNYITGCMQLGLTPGWTAELRAEGGIIETLLAEALDGAKDGATRRVTAAALAWARRTLRDQRARHASPWRNLFGLRGRQAAA